MLTHVSHVDTCLHIRLQTGASPGRLLVLHPHRQTHTHADPHAHPFPSPSPLSPPPSPPPLRPIPLPFFPSSLQHLVPIYSFGENDLYPQAFRNESGTFVRRVQEFWLKRIGYATPYFCGSGAFCMPAIPGNPIPRRHPIITVIGDPIECPKIEHPTEADIEKLKVQVCITMRCM